MTRKPTGEPGESKSRAAIVVRLLKKHYSDAECALAHETPFQLLAATILSAQCTDERVNRVTPALFAAFPDAKSMAAADRPEIERLIRTCGFFRAKAKSLLGMAEGLAARHAGEVPRRLDELVALPGVGRKTANVVLGTAFGIPTGVVVDTHVARLTRRLGLTAAKTPENIERDLMALLPRKEWIMFSHRLIWHGRKICIARRPKCGACPLASVCPRIGVTSSD